MPPSSTMGDLLQQPMEKLTISGSTLAAILRRLSSSLGDADGLLFGHVTRLPPPELHDDDDIPSSSAPVSSPLAASITGHLCFGSPMSFYDSLGRVDAAFIRKVLDRRPPGSSLLGWFSGRRQSPLRHSLREFSVTVSLAKALKTLTPQQALRQDLAAWPLCIFMLLSTSSAGNLAIHTHEYKAFELVKVEAGIGHLAPKSVTLVNVGPGFRGHYGAFSPESLFPMMPLEKEEVDEKSLIRLKQTSQEQSELDRLAEGFGVDRLRHMVRSDALRQKSDLEDLYIKMLLKLEDVASRVEKSSIEVLEQENLNLKLRRKLAGLE